MKQYLWFCCIIATLALANSDLLGAKECTYGPSFWCGSLSNAKKCSAVSHCIQSVWEKSSLPVDNDGVCDLCKEMIAEARKELMSNDVQIAVKRVVAYYCQAVPLKDIELECENLADEYIDELIQTLVSQMNPHILCATIGLCNSIKVDRMLHTNKISSMDRFVPQKSQEVSIKGQECDECKVFFKEAIAIIQSVPREQVLNTFLSICGRFGSYSDSCKAIVEVNFDSIYSLIIMKTNPDSICRFVGVCAGKTSNKLVSLPKTGDEPCDYCVEMVTFWKQMLVRNTTKEEFRDMLKQICNQIPNFKVECKVLVDTYYDEAYNVLISDIKPHKMCEAIGICGIHSVITGQLPLWTLFDLEPSNKLPLTKIKPVHSNLIETDQDASYRTPHLSKVHLSKTDIDVASHGQSGLLMAGKDVQSKDICIMCEFVLHFLQNVLQDGPTRKEVIDALDHVCTLMPRSIVEECQDYVDAYGDELISLLILGLDPAKDCPELGLCPGVTSKISSDSTCIMCEFAITQLEEMLKDNKTEETIKKALESVCSIMPHSIKSECIDFVDQYYDQLIRLLISELTPDEICQELGLCSDKSNLGALPSPKDAQLPISRLFVPELAKEPESNSNLKLEQSAACIICECIVRDLDKMILNNSTVEEVESALAKVCSLLPSTLQNDCLGFIEEYAKPLLQMFIAQELDPDFFCRTLTLCSDSFTNAMPKAIVTRPVPNPKKCSLCDEVLNMGKAWIKLTGIKFTVKILVNDICPIISNDAKKVKECQEFARERGPMLLELFEKYTPQEVCQMSGYCTEHQMFMPGASKCTWGPAYWCKSQLHATICSAMDHCKKVIWGGTIPAL